MPGGCGVVSIKTEWVVTAQQNSNSNESINILMLARSSFWLVIACIREYCRRVSLPL
jgi:hypothetical protein